MIPKKFRNLVGVLLIPFISFGLLSSFMLSGIAITDLFHTANPFAQVLTKAYLWLIFLIGPIAGVVGYVRWWFFTSSISQKNHLLFTLGLCLFSLPSAVLLISTLISMSNWVSIAYVLVACVCILCALGELAFLIWRSVFQGAQ